MKLSPIIQVLRDTCLSLDRRVFGTFAWFTVDTQSNPKMPCAFVLPGEVKGGTFRASTRFREDIENTFSVNIAVALDKDDILGKCGHDQIEDLKAEVFRSLLGLPLGYPEETNVIIRFVDQQVNLAACNAARLVETLTFAYDETLTGDGTAQQRLIDDFPTLRQVRLRAPNYQTTDGDDSSVTAELLTSK